MKIRTFVFLCLIISVLIGCTSETKTISVKPSTADFEDVYLGDSKDIVLTLKNKFGKLITITNLLIEGATDVSIDANVTTPFDMDKNAEYSLTITYTPLNDGPFEGLLKIRHSESTKEKEVKLRGNGVPVARIRLSETSYDFQKKLVSKSHTHNFEIENIGTALLEITDMTFYGLGASSYSITSGDAPVNIQPNGKHTFTVSFAPLAVGNYTAELAITHNAINESVPYNIQVDGEGVLTDPRITLSVGSNWDLGSVAKTIPSTQICEIENTGIDPLTITSSTLTTSAEIKIVSTTDANGNALNYPIQVAVGAKVYLAVTFSPTANQPYNDKLSIVHDGTNELSPLEIPVTGTGRDEISKTFVYTGSVEQWTVPQGVSSVRIEAWGAEGGENCSNVNCAGKGARMRGDFVVTPGESLSIVVGQTGFKPTTCNVANGGAGGGGGSFVWRKTNDTFPMIAAGGGGGSCLQNSGVPNYYGKPGVKDKDGTGSRSHDVYNNSPGGTNGNDGKSVTISGGSGWVTIKTNPAGGTPGCTYGGQGGYGGGGGGGNNAPNNWLHVAGGGGGYSGGGAGGNNYYFGGGGGGSYNDGANQSNDSDINQGDGEVKISY